MCPPCAPRQALSGRPLTATACVGLPPVLASLSPDNAQTPRRAQCPPQRQVKPRLHTSLGQCCFNLWGLGVCPHDTSLHPTPGIVQSSQQHTAHLHGMGDGNGGIEGSEDTHGTLLYTYTGFYTQASVPNMTSASVDTALAYQFTLRQCVRPCLHVCASPCGGQRVWDFSYGGSGN